MSAAQFSDTHADARLYIPFRCVPPTDSIASLPSEKANREIDILVSQTGNDICSECSRPGMNGCMHVYNTSY